MFEVGTIIMKIPLATLTTVFVLLSSCYATKPVTKQPHIIFILADDLGWDDVSMHGSKQIPTPNIDSLATAGIHLNNYYVQPVCSPTRAALMTGKYPIHTGFQDGVIYPGQPYGVDLKEVLLPTYLKKMGYSTHAIGKWHLGMFAEEYTPRHRGFDTFMGFYNGAEGYFTHLRAGGLDLRRNGEILRLPGQYNTELFTAEAESIISKHNKSQPMFMYLAHQSAHAPYQAPEDWIEKFKDIDDPKRRNLAAMISYMDHGIGRVRDSLQKAGMLEDSIIVFSTDNGGPTSKSLRASNYPLRGVKHTLWEGGVRGAGFVYGSPFSQRAGNNTNALMHVTDWLPTLVEAAGGETSALSGLDGVSQYKSLVKGTSSPRTEVLVNIQETKGKKGKSGGINAALKVGNMKIIMGQGTKDDGWYKPRGVTEQKHTVECGQKPEKTSHCSDGKVACLFDLEKDPCEYNNLYGVPKYKSTYEKMFAKLQKYRKGAVKSRKKKVDPKSNPKLHGGVWVPWVKLS